jgi:hypothetical protein
LLYDKFPVLLLILFHYSDQVFIFITFISYPLAINTLPACCPIVSRLFPGHHPRDGSVHYFSIQANVIFLGGVQNINKKEKERKDKEPDVENAGGIMGLKKEKRKLKFPTGSGLGGLRGFVQ